MKRKLQWLVVLLALAAMVQTMAFASKASAGKSPETSGTQGEGHPGV